MKPDELKVKEILERPWRFVVPLYQRQYQWHDSRDSDRTRVFWEDVAEKAEEILGCRAKFEHYMGALLLAPGLAQQVYGMTPVAQVVDGQQRLTTFLILLSAIRQIAIKRGFEEVCKQCEKYLFVEPGTSDRDEHTRFKLTPTPVDREIFFDVLELPLTKVRDKYRTAYWGGRVPANTKYRSLRAYEYFVSQIEGFLTLESTDGTEVNSDERALDKDNPESQEDHNLAQRRLESLLEALVFHLKLIVITLDEKDDAQVIFETLNSRGQPLLVMDLVRNNIFHRAEAQYRHGNEDKHREEGGARERAEHLYERVWAPFDDAWWRESAPNARPSRPRIDHFLANVLTSETGERITVRELYSEYRAWATPNRRPRFDDVEDELAVLQKYVPTYETLEGREGGKQRDQTLAWLGTKFRAWQSTTAYPVAFQIAGNGIDQETRQQIAVFLDSYFTRRALCDLTAKNLNYLFPRLVNVFRKDGVSITTMRRFFEGQNDPSTRFPSDAELRIGILEKQAYGRIPSRIVGDILWDLELGSRSTKTEETARPSSLSVEHVMPVKWQEHWPLKNEAGDPVDKDDPLYLRREAAVHTIGNLTIVTDSLNSSLKNHPFERKKSEIFAHSNLTLNRHISQYDNWDEEVIRKRGENLAALACEIWPALLRKRTGLSISEVFKNGLRAYAASARDETAEPPYAVFRRLDLGSGGYAAAPARRAKTSVAAVIGEKHGR